MYASPTPEPKSSEEKVSRRLALSRQYIKVEHVICDGHRDDAPVCRAREFQCSTLKQKNLLQWD